jgi:hypothetical protein
MLNLTSYYVCTSVTKGGNSRSEVFNDFVTEESPRYWTGCVMYRIETDNEEDLGQGWHVTLKHPQSSNDFITRRIKKRREPRGSNVGRHGGPQTSPLYVFSFSDFFSFFGGLLAALRELANSAQTLQRCLWLWAQQLSRPRLLARAQELSLRLCSAACG